MNLEREDYVDPRCALCGKPGEEETVQPVPVGRIMDKLREYEDRNDWPAVERHLKYWLAEAEANRDERGQLMLHNELMGYYRKQGKKDEAFSHAEKADYLVKKLEMEDTVTAGTTWVNTGTVREAFGDPVGGLEFFERAQANYEKNLPDNDGRLGGLYNNMALSLAVFIALAAMEISQKALSVLYRREFHVEDKGFLTGISSDKRPKSLKPSQKIRMPAFVFTLLINLFALALRFLLTNWVMFFSFI